MPCIAGNPNCNCSSASMRGLRGRTSDYKFPMTIGAFVQKGNLRDIHCIGSQEKPDNFKLSPASGDTDNNGHIK